MSFFSVLFALLIEQVRPLARGNPVHTVVQVWVAWCARNLDAGQRSFLWLAWWVATMIPVMLAALGFYLADQVGGWPLVLIWSVAVLYLCLGFRQFSFHFTEVRQALAAGQMDQALELLARWQKTDPADIPEQELVGRFIEASTLAAHRHVFGVLTWFSIGAALGLGPAGAVFYRVAEMLARYWRSQPAQQSGPVVSPELSSMTAQMWQLTDWLPSRATAVAFAVVGNFEDALEGWRTWSRLEAEDHDGLILCAAGGALGLQLPSLAASGSEDAARPIFEPPDNDSLSAVVGLVWRSVVLWMVLIALLTLARLLG